MKANVPGLTILVLTAAISSSCLDPSRTAEAKAEAASAPTATKSEPRDLKPINVEVAPVTLSSLTEYVSVSGTTLADADVTYSAEVAGRVDYMVAELGDPVQKGQTLARIDYRMLKAQADAAHASFGLAQQPVYLHLRAHPCPVSQ